MRGSAWKTERNASKRVENRFSYCSKVLVIQTDSQSGRDADGTIGEGKPSLAFLTFSSALHSLTMLIYLHLIQSEGNTPLLSPGCTLFFTQLQTCSVCINLLSYFISNEENTVFSCVLNINVDYFNCLVLTAHQAFYRRRKWKQKLVFFFLFEPPSVPTSEPMQFILFVNSNFSLFVCV